MEDIRVGRERIGYPMDMREAEVIKEEYNIEIYEPLYLLFFKFCKEKGIDAEEVLEVAIIEFMDNHQSN